MKEAEIERCIFSHDARNLQLRRKLAERSVDLRDECRSVCHFLAPNQKQGKLLEQELHARGFLEVDITPAGKTGGWCVDAQIRMSMEQASSHEFTEEMVRSAAALFCIYDGWRALIPRQDGEY